VTIAKLDILDDVESSLLAITIGNGYRTTVRTVDREVKVRHEVGSQQMPYIGFGLTETTSEPTLPGGLIRCVSRMTVLAHVSAASADDATTVLAGLEDDIIAALMGAPTRDGNAIDTLWMRTVEDVPDPASPTSTGRGSMAMEFEIRWVRSVDRST
jgi:hypothetical protein